MTDIKQYTRRMRSRQDQQLYKITYPSYDPNNVQSIQIHLGPGQYHFEGQSIGTVYLKKQEKETLVQNQQSLFTFNLTTSVVGNIEKIGGIFIQSQKVWKLIEGTKKCSLELMYIRECQHLIQKQTLNYTNRDNVSENLTNSYSKCPKCNKQITMYYQSQEQIITLQYLFRDDPQISSQNLQNLEWTIILNQPFTPNTVIAKLGHMELKLPFIGKATYLLGEGEKPLKNVLMKVRRGVCKHQKIIANQCQICFQIIKKEEAQEFIRYLFQLGPDGSEKSKTKGQALVLQEQEFITSLLKKKKLILVLDLDNTILHSNEISQLDWNLLLRVKDFFVLPRFDKAEKRKQDYALIKMRPYLKEFLFVISKLFEVFIYTKGSRLYAEGIGRQIRAIWAGQQSLNQINTWSEPHLTFLKDTECFLPNRLISRDQDSIIEKKQFKKILPTKTDYHIILDDRRDVWDNSPAWFFTRQFFYFCKQKRQEEYIIEQSDDYLDDRNQNLPYLSKLADFYKMSHQNYPQKIKEYKIQLNEKPDFFLLFAAHALKIIHSLFFQQFKKTRAFKAEKQKEEVISLAYILQRSKQFMKDKKIRLFLPPGDQSLSTARRCLKLGGVLLADKNTQKPDYVIRGNNYIKYIKKWSKERSEKQQTFIRKQANHIKTQKINQIQQQTEDNNQASQELKFQPNISQKQAQQNSFLQRKEQKKIQSKGGKKSSIDLLILHQIKQQKQDYQDCILQLEALYKAGIPIISETWIHASYEYTYKFKIQDFKLQNPFIENLQHQQFDSIIAQKAEKIRVQIINNYNLQNKVGQKKKLIQNQQQSSSIKNSEQNEQQRSPAQKTQELYKKIIF